MMPSALSFSRAAARNFPALGPVGLIAVAAAAEQPQAHMLITRGDAKPDPKARAKKPRRRTMAPKIVRQPPS